MTLYLESNDTESLEQNEHSVRFEEATSAETLVERLSPPEEIRLPEETGEGLEDENQTETLAPESSESVVSEIEATPPTATTRSSKFKKFWREAGGSISKVRDALGQKVFADSHPFHTHWLDPSNQNSSTYT